MLPPNAAPAQCHQIDPALCHIDPALEAAPAGTPANAVAGPFPDGEDASAGRKGKGKHSWSREETMTLVSLLKGNLTWQLMLIPGRATREQEKGLKTKKTTMLREMFGQLFPNERNDDHTRVKSKILTMHRQYTAERDKMGHTGAGLLFEEVTEGTTVSINGIAFG